ncbi:MAG: bifunctional folylpolyglutamate synthase/dihydrofolate synthase [Candidatus Methylomirabilia bacterium]
MRPGRERIETMLEALGRPEGRFQIVQVGGTNGKGSVAVMIAAILKALGLRVGLYSSPHLCSFRERIRVDGAAIPEEDVADGVEALGTLIARLNVTMFEAATALALDHFARQDVEVAVLEVGLGGRLDATTVGTPLVEVVTRIDYDHQVYLGWRIEDIAREKIAIIRSGMAVSATQAAEVTPLVIGQAQAAGVPLLLDGRELSASVEARDLSGQQLTLSGPGWRLGEIFLPLLGSFQPGNALLAVQAVRALSSSGIEVKEEAIRQGLAGVRWPGRFQLTGRDPWVVLDGAHNPGGAQALATSLRDFFGGVPTTLVVGISADKDKAGILKALTPLASRLILTASSNPRATQPRELQGLLPPTEAGVEVADTVAEALSLALAPPTTPVVCVCGSLFCVADVLALSGGSRDIPCGIERGADSM